MNKAKAVRLAARNKADLQARGEKVRHSIGDVVVADYYGSTVVGRISGFDGSGYVYLDAIAPGSCEHNGRANDDGLALAPDQRSSMVRIGRKAFASICNMPTACLGGSYGTDLAVAS